MAYFSSYEINGKKLSFANWISNLSPTDTFFTSATGKEAIQQTLFQWQTDRLAPASTTNAVIEGAAAGDDTDHVGTFLQSNVTQILRKVVKVSDTANALANYGRGRELQYQMEKAGKEIKRDLEKTLLSDQGRVDGTTAVGGAGAARKTAGFIAQVGLKDATGAVGGDFADPDTGAVALHYAGTKAALTDPTEEALFGLTYDLYLAGANADTIMFHPRHAQFFSSLQEKSAVTGGTRTRMFENTPKLSVFVSEIVDPLGQVFKLVPNRFAHEDYIYIFNPSDWTQMVLRAPQRVQLAKDGSYEKWMIEMEVGLRHRNPFASGLLKVKAKS